MLNHITNLCSKLHTKDRNYCVFLGAGFSRDAGIPTGWDVLIDTIKPIFLQKNKIDTQISDLKSDIETWFLNNEQLKNLGYSEILEKALENELERKAHLKNYFEGREPGNAHRELAKLILNGYIRFVFTTNFDNLLEKALEELNVDYDVICDDKDIETTYSWDKVKYCRIYKLHGDYKKGKIRNTLDELEKLDDGIQEEFKYIINRHGLIFIGYAGNDIGVMQCLNSRNISPSSYPIYWQFMKTSNEEKSELLKVFMETARVKFASSFLEIPNINATQLLSELSAGIERLDLYISPQVESKEYYRDLIVNNDNKRIHATSIKLIEKYKTLYQEYLQKSKSADNYISQYEIFRELIAEIKFLYQYFDSLLEMDSNNTDEISYLLKNIINFNHENSYASKNFIERVMPYCNILGFTALLLKYEKEPQVIELINTKYLANDNREYVISDLISYEFVGWSAVKQEKRFSYFFTQYEEVVKLFTPIIEQQYIENADAYITLYSILSEKGIKWLSGSIFAEKSFIQITLKYYSVFVENSNAAKEFRIRISEYLKKINMNRPSSMYGIINLFQYLDNKYGTPNE